MATDGPDFSHIKNFFQNILLKTAWLCDVRLQNYGAINFVPFLDHPVCSTFWRCQLRSIVTICVANKYFFTNSLSSTNRLWLLDPPWRRGREEVAGQMPCLNIILSQFFVEKCSFKRTKRGAIILIIGKIEILSTFCWKYAAVRLSIGKLQLCVPRTFFNERRRWRTLCRCGVVDGVRGVRERVGDGPVGKVPRWHSARGLCAS